MENSKTLKIILISLISLLIIFIGGHTFAANTIDITNLTSNSSSGNTASTNNLNNTTTVNSSNTAKNNTLTTSNQTSNYNNTSLPTTGIGDSMPVTLLVIVLGISAVYAYKKIQDYRKI